MSNEKDKKLQEKEETKPIELTFVEPTEYFPKEIRKKFFGEDDEEE